MSDDLRELQASFDAVKRAWSATTLGIPQQRFFENIDWDEFLIWMATFIDDICNLEQTIHDTRWRCEE